MAVYQQYVTDLIDNIKKALVAVDPTPFFTRYGNNSWAAVQTYQAAAWAWSLSPAFHLGERLLRARMGGLGQRVERVADLVPPAPLLAGLGEHLADRRPEPQGTVADREHRRGHATALTAAEQTERRLARFAVPVVRRDEFLGAVRADPHRHQQAHFVLLQPDLEVDPVDPQ
jgi:hypothetical protein